MTVVITQSEKEVYYGEIKSLFYRHAYQKW